MLENTKGVIRNRKLKDGQYTGNRTNNDLQNSTPKTKDWEIRIPTTLVASLFYYKDWAIRIPTTLVASLFYY
jgi:hypothetical protein